MKKKIRTESEIISELKIALEECEVKEINLEEITTNTTFEGVDSLDMYEILYAFERNNPKIKTTEIEKVGFKSVREFVDLVQAQKTEAAESGWRRILTMWRQ